MGTETLIDIYTGRRARVRVRSFGSWGGASEISADDFRDWARRVRRARAAERALAHAAAGDTSVFADEFHLVTRGEYCCGLMVRGDNDARAAWVGDGYDDSDDGCS